MGEHTSREQRSRGRSMGPLRERLRGGRPLLLDGATGTELERRGVRTGLPLWSTHALLEAPDTLRAIHLAYARAGAEILTANTFRTQRRALARGRALDPSLGPLEERDRELCELAVTLAREAAASASPHAAWVAGSAPPLEDCYRPERVPDDRTLAREHARHAENLAAADADLVLIETMNTTREALAALRAARDVGLPRLLSFVSWQAGQLLSGEPLADALAAAERYEPLAVLVNCLPPSAVNGCLAPLQGSAERLPDSAPSGCLAPVNGCLAPVQNSALPFGVYANLGEPEGEFGFRRSESCTPEEFAEHARGWIAAGARLVGGCCGTTPAHVAAIARLLDRLDRDAARRDHGPQRVAAEGE